MRNAFYFFTHTLKLDSDPLLTKRREIASPRDLGRPFRNGGPRLFTLLGWGMEFRKSARDLGRPFRNGRPRSLGGEIRDRWG